MCASDADTPTLEKVADGFYVRQEVDNIGWVDLGGSALVVDALERRELEGEVFSAIEQTLGDTPVRYLVNTHLHGDHTALNDAFRRRFGPEIVHNADGAIPPEGRWIEGPRRRAQVVPIGGTHTREDVIVWVPEDEAVFVGDIFGWGLINYSRLLDPDVVNLIDGTYERLIGLGARTVIPGHGPLCSTDELRRWRGYLHWLIDGVRRGVAAGRSDAEIGEELSPPEDMKHWWRLLDWKHADSFNKVLRSVRSGSLPG
jgi:cyclase